MTADVRAGGVWDPGVRDTVFGVDATVADDAWWDVWAAVASDVRDGVQDGVQPAVQRAADGALRAAGVRERSA